MLKFVNNFMMRCKSLLDLIDIVSDNFGKNEYKHYKFTLEYTKNVDITNLWLSKLSKISNF